MVTVETFPFHGKIRMVEPGIIRHHILEWLLRNYAGDNLSFTGANGIGSTVDNKAVPLKISIYCLVSTMWQLFRCTLYRTDTFTVGVPQIPVVRISSQPPVQPAVEVIWLRRSLTRAVHCHLWDSPAIVLPLTTRNPLSWASYRNGLQWTFNSQT
jgi:hypothetical protein